MSAVKNILNGNILYPPRSISCNHNSIYHGEICPQCHASVNRITGRTDPWLENFWGSGARSILYQQQQAQSASYMAAQQAYMMQANQQRMLREQAVRNAEMAYAQEMERLKQDERRGLFGEELFALMSETDRLAKLI